MVTYARKKAETILDKQNLNKNKIEKIWRNSWYLFLLVYI